MGEHDDDLEMSPASESGRDAARVAEALASGLDRIALAVERGLDEVARAIASAEARPRRHATHTR